ncbi:hypothetical protein GCM10010488_12210 [Oerskovia jenensis]
MGQFECESTEASTLGSVAAWESGRLDPVTTGGWGPRNIAKLTSNESERQLGKRRIPIVVDYKSLQLIILQIESTSLHI